MIYLYSIRKLYKHYKIAHKSQVCGGNNPTDGHTKLKHKITPTVMLQACMFAETSCKRINKAQTIINSASKTTVAILE